MTGADLRFFWRIDADRIYLDGDPFPDATGTTGPRDAQGASLLPYSAKFKLHDDDGELYYEGTLFWADPDGPSENACYSPLRDFGAGSGCTLVTYPGHPEMDCG